LTSAITVSTPLGARGAAAGFGATSDVGAAGGAGFGAVCADAPEARRNAANPYTTQDAADGLTSHLQNVVTWKSEKPAWF